MNKTKKWLAKQKGSPRFSGGYQSMDHVYREFNRAVAERYRDFISDHGELLHEIDRPREAARHALHSLGRVADTISCNWIGETKSYCIEFAEDAHDTAAYALLNMTSDPTDPEMEQRIHQQLTEDTAWAMYYWMFS